ncbi:hypothetical protein AGABI2DRAFT_116022 [Agaricus bisporus var. bisporus H97]|uniref:hypothetical protein n=1 Tax=Agaricus bisporus var. bisporus (strain H97 / ATCC MYA-4626 / FGSC 10389) TaxID=936046 RepID=UPI00029F5CCA|nr:hypothetical protein AGABI2DRAFT_116022 [Agaricus bisporus var. bisporus H97]EKV48975.1 hypothetical protein AGABI2DRAFT_116022 [Agaricus bisporus var. bisporus H97]
MSSFSSKPCNCLVLKPPRPHFHLESAYVPHERLQPAKRRRFKLLRKVDSLSIFAHVPVDIFYEISLYLHPQDLLNLSRSTRRLRELLMTRNARFVWVSALSNVEGLPRCPSDLCEPQFANLSFDEHCHFCLAPKVKIILWNCRPFSRTPLHSFLTIDQLTVAYPKTLDILKPETIFPNVTYHNTDSSKPGKVLFYKPQVELYLRELAEIDRKNEDVRSSMLSKWCLAKRRFYAEVVVVSLSLVLFL